ncbi:beta-ketoacyl-ACP synthase II [Dyadobacter flavalbus]|uniref:3-oxoacyl-[acyl-carrier-protein] synthase 2 n=1 Tax=Dyadobacter flavalbus TaxID=2579942 RepID=A0A5M8R1N1_9BACT|nr:beta-ketoacyl-ACP synthase II [Dyadobacter flavalbus]KAA6440102.1 beta-ketoacyl-ACP synthase II [Dyadobacter flavalbus]
MSLKRVVITGMGALTPIGNDVSTFWKNLVAGVSGAAPITRFDAEKFRTRFACEVKGLDINNYIPRQEARKMDPFAQYAVIAADEAMKDAGFGADTLDLDKAGVIWGAGIGGLKTFEDEVMGFAENGKTPRFNPFFIPKMIVDSASGILSIRYGFRGPNFITVSACASATNALIDAYNYIKLGMMNVCISGGSEAAITNAGVGGFNALKALSERNDSPETASRPYDKDRDGFVLGEGGAAIILEELDHAKARGAKIYAEMIGVGMSSDAYHITAPHPDGLGAQIVMKNAVENAGLNPEDIDYINTHGTSTPIGDPQEIKAIEKYFGEHAYKMNISSTKSMTGHLLGGAGAIEAAACIMAIKDQIIPPTINHFTDDPDINPALNLTFNEAQKRTVNIALSNTFGFGGHNASVIFKKYED